MPKKFGSVWTCLIPRSEEILSGRPLYTTNRLKAVKNALVVKYNITSRSQQLSRKWIHPLQGHSIDYQISDIQQIRLLKQTNLSTYLDILLIYGWYKSDLLFNMTHNDGTVKSRYLCNVTRHLIN